MSRPTWPDLAACDGKGDMFTAEPNEHLSRTDVTELREAAAHICASCPVRNQCGATAEADRLTPATPENILIRPFGIWGGLFYDGTSRPPHDPLRHALIRHLNAQNKPDGVIAETLGITAGQVRFLRAKLGLPAAFARRPRPMGDFQHGQPGDGGRRKHIRRGEIPCDECMEASREYSRRKQAEIRRRRREQQEAA